MRRGFRRRRKGSPHLLCILGAEVRRIQPQQSVVPRQPTAHVPACLADNCAALTSFLIRANSALNTFLPRSVRV